MNSLQQYRAFVKANINKCRGNQKQRMKECAKLWQEYKVEHGIKTAKPVKKGKKSSGGSVKSALKTAAKKGLSAAVDHAVKLYSGSGFNAKHYKNCIKKFKKANKNQDYHAELMRGYVEQL